MLVITAELLHGTIRASSADDVSLTGQGGGAEWPPSPARLFSALVAADGTGPRCRVTDGAELRLLESARPPVIGADPVDLVEVTDLRERFVVLNVNSAGHTVHEYPLRDARAVRSGARVAPRTPTITYEWSDLEVTDASLEALRRRAGRVGYLGCADSPVRLHVALTPPAGTTAQWVPDEAAGSTLLPVPFVGFVDVLDEMYRQFCEGRLVRRTLFPSRLARYRPPGRTTSISQRRTVWLRFASAVPGRRVIDVTEALRAALLERYVPVDGDGADEDPGGVPRVLHGHGFTGTGYETACYLALADVGFPYSRGRIHGAAVVLPAGAPAPLAAGVRLALAGIRVLERPGVFRTRVALHAGEPRPIAADPTRWEGPAHRWVSVFPVVHERHRRGGPNIDDVASWCRHAGMPAPVAFRASRVPLVRGALSLMPHEVSRPGRARAPYSHLEVEFGSPVKGPFVLGRGRQFGLGLMVPVHMEA